MLRGRLPSLARPLLSSRLATKAAGGVARPVAAAFVAGARRSVQTAADKASLIENDKSSDSIKVQLHEEYFKSYLCEMPKLEMDVPKEQCVLVPPTHSTPRTTLPVVARVQLARVEVEENARTRLSYLRTCRLSSPLNLPHADSPTLPRLIQIYKEMVQMRRMEMAADQVRTLSLPFSFPPEISLILFLLARLQLYKAVRLPFFIRPLPLRTRSRRKGVRGRKRRDEWWKRKGVVKVVGM